MVAKKREKKTGNPARSRFVIGRGGGPFGRYISVLEWCSVAPTVVYFVSFGQHLGTICTFISQSTKSVEIETEFEILEFFVSLHPLRVQVMDISPRHCVHCADRSTMPRNISSSFSLLRFPPQFAPSFVISLLLPLFLFFFRFAIESFLRSFLIFFPIRSSLPLSFTRKKKNTMERDFIRRYLKKAIFR